ncbi:MAG TPA: NAD(P)H-binding protein [Geothrix sp.]
MAKQVVIAGGTGEVGQRLLALMAGNETLQVRVLTRRPGLPVQAPNLAALPFDYDDPTAYGRLFAEPCDLLLIALGTTRAVAGSDAAFLRVDRDYPIQLIQALAAAWPSARVGLVSSVGADQPRGLYLGAKAAVEGALTQSGLAHAIARPSMLRSQRQEFRLGEVAMDRLLSPAILALGRGLFPRSRGWWRWAPVHVREVAASLLAATLVLDPGERCILEDLDLHPGPITHWGRP